MAFKIIFSFVSSRQAFSLLGESEKDKEKKKVNITVYKSRKQVRKKYRDIYNCVSTSLTTLLSSAMLKPQSDIF